MGRSSIINQRACVCSSPCSACLPVDARSWESNFGNSIFETGSLRFLFLSRGLSDGMRSDAILSEASDRMNPLIWLLFIQFRLCVGEQQRKSRALFILCQQIRLICIQSEIISMTVRALGPELRPQLGFQHNQITLTLHEAPECNLLSTRRYESDAQSHWIGSAYIREAEPLAEFELCIGLYVSGKLRGPRNTSVECNNCIRVSSFQF